MNVVICASRFAPEVNKVRDCLQNLFEEAGLSLPNANGVDEQNEIFFCEDLPTNSQVSKQDGINSMICDADWVIVIAPLNLVSDIIKEEVEQAVKAFYENKNGMPVLTILHCKNYYDYDENKTEEKFYDSSTQTPIKEKEGHVNIKELETVIQNIINQYTNSSGRIYFADYEYDKDYELLFESLSKQFKKNLENNFFTFQHLIGYAKLGKNIEASDLYFDRQRANVLNGFGEGLDNYFTRKSVDGQLYDYFEREKIKYTILLGAPGSGKTRAVYQLLPEIQKQNGKEYYAMGILAEEQVIVLRQENVRIIYIMLLHEKSFNEYLKNSDNKYQPKECVIICDQVKEVFQMLKDEELYEFFNLLDEMPYLRFIATSLPKAFKNFCARWGDNNTLNPFYNKSKSRDFTIPSLMNDEEKADILNWLKFKFSIKNINDYNHPTIGEYIPHLNDYKQRIVNSLYEGENEVPYLSQLLRSFQIAETYRKETALFLPVLIARSLIGENRDNIFKEKMAETLNFLIENNVIWIIWPDGKIKDKITKDDFNLNWDGHKEINKDVFIFDNELYENTILPTNYIYGLNDIIWNYLETEDFQRYQDNRNDKRLLINFHSVDGICLGAIAFYNAVKRMSTLHRILSRIPRKDDNAYVSALAIWWKFTFKKCKEVTKENISSNNIKEYVHTIGLLIGRSDNLEYAKKVITLLKERDIKPNYNILGELYSLGIRKKIEIGNYIENFRNKNSLYGNSPFSLARKISFHEYSFDDSLEQVKSTDYIIGTDKLRFEEYIDKVRDNRLEMSAIYQLLTLLAQKADTMEQWHQLLELYKQGNLYLQYTILQHLFAVAAKPEIQSVDKCLIKLLPKELTDSKDEDAGQYKTLLSEQYYEYAVVCALDNSANFQQAEFIYDIYFKMKGNDNPILLSIALREMKNIEFQKAFKFLTNISERMRANGKELNTIVFNNLIKKAPNLDEALYVASKMKTVDEFTLSNILNVIEKKRHPSEGDNKVSDLKKFFYAYYTTMQPMFSEIRYSPYVIGNLYNLAQTPKQERFIYETLLKDMNQTNKVQLIDYNTKITSIRISKNYRNYEEAWYLFNVCKNHHTLKQLLIPSELYSNMLRKLNYLNKEEDINRIIDEILNNGNSIVRDQYFISTLYRFDKKRTIFDKNGQISEQFNREIWQSKINDIRVFNVLLEFLKKGQVEFILLWKFYQYMKAYYIRNNRMDSLCPNYRTLTLLMESVNTKEEYDSVKEEAKKNVDKGKTTEKLSYNNSVQDAERRLNISQMHSHNNKVPLKIDIKTILGILLNRIRVYETITPVTLNKELDKVVKIMKEQTNIEERKKIQNDVIQFVRNNMKSLILNNHSYISLMKLTPSQNDAREWIDALLKNKDVIQYDEVVCHEMACSPKVAKYNIKILCQFMDYWKKIMKEIGYDPNDKTSFFYNEHNKKKQEKDFWGTYKYHFMLVNNYYNKVGSPKDLKNRIENDLKFLKDNEVSV